MNLINFVKKWNRKCLLMAETQAEALMSENPDLPHISC